MNDGYKLIIENRKAHFRYQIIETYEAGIVLLGMEIKSLREGKVNISEAYVRPSNGTIQILGMHINRYSHTSDKHYEPERPRFLLMHKREIIKLSAEVQSKGLTVVPVKLYLKRGMAKLQIALARGKDVADKREAIKSRDVERDIKRKFKI